MQKTVLLAGLALALFSPALAAPAPAAQDRWFEIVGPAGQRIGYQHEVIRAVPGGFERERLRALSYRIDGHPKTRVSNLLVRRYDQLGRLLSFYAEQLSGKQQLVSDGQLQGGKATIRRSLAGKIRTRTVTWPETLDLGDALAAEQQAGTSAELSASGLRYDLREVDIGFVGDDGGRPRLSTVGDRLYSFDYLRADGTIVVPKVGYALQLRPLAQPLDPAASIPVAALAHEMKVSPFYVSDSALRGHIRYRFGFLYRQGWPIPYTGEQSIRVDGSSFVVDICATCGPNLPADPASLARWRHASAWIESDDPLFRRLAGNVPKTGSGAARMAALGTIARNRMQGIDYEGHISALAAWRRGSGDCTEDAVVLAALARAAGIPARVASGLVYSRSRYHGAANAFLPHSWVVAWTDGRWRSYDISLSAFDASHIALSLGDGEPAAITEATVLAALLDWQAMTEIRKRD